MAKEDVITQESFDVLLRWLDPNREAAGQKYEKIRARLIRIFAGRGCFEAEELTDATIDRVTQKLPQFADGYIGEPALYFYGVADKIYLEWLRKQKKIKQLPLLEVNSFDETEFEDEYECLKSCLETLAADQQQLIVEYYRKDKSAKIESRKQLAEDLGLSANALQIKASRLRALLRKCVQKCVGEKKSE